VNAQSIVLECLISGEQRPEILVVDPACKSINSGKRTIQAEVTAENIIWGDMGACALWIGAQVPCPITCQTNPISRLDSVVHLRRNSEHSPSNDGGFNEVDNASQSET